MNCKCGKEARKLWATKKGLLGACCYESQPQHWTGLNQTFCTGDGMRITQADRMNIRTNKLRSDGTYKPDPRWR